MEANPKCKPDKKVYNPLTCRCVGRGGQVAKRLKQELITEIDSSVFYPPINHAQQFASNGKFTDEYMDALRARIKTLGFAVAPSHVAVSNAEAAQVGALTQAHGHPIFEYPERNDDGDYVYDDDGVLQWSNGCEQRKQLSEQFVRTHVNANDPRKATFQQVKARFQPLVDQFKGRGQRVQSMVCIISEPTDAQGRAKPGGPQVLHCDVEPGEDSCAVIAALENNTTLLVVPFSSSVMQGAGILEDVEWEDLAPMVPHFPLIRLRLQRGDLFVMNGNLIHAGDQGQPGRRTPRFHWYIQGNNVDDVTFPVLMMGDAIESRFVPAPIQEEQWW
jgi:hypothetical protein